MIASGTPRKECTCVANDLGVVSGTPVRGT